MTYQRMVRGTLILPTGPLEQGWIAISDGRIAAIGSGDAPAAQKSEDYGAAFILPGVVDGQTHACNARGLPGIEPTTRSAIAGGVTTIVDMPYDEPDPLTGVEQLRNKVDAIARYAHCDVALYGTLAAGQPAEDMGALIDGGVCAFKISSFESHPKRFPRIGTAQIREMFDFLAETGLPLGIHNEDQEIVLAEAARFKAEGRNTIRDHADSRPEIAELSATVQFLEIGAAAGAHAHIVHLSTPRGFHICQRYADEGFTTTGELCVHYLFFDPDRDGDRLGGKLKVNPPIRPGMSEKLWDELAEGRVAFVSSDHASWPLERKQKDSIFDVAPGVPGLETILPAFATGAAARWADGLERTAYYLSEAPAKFFGLYPRKGVIAVGADADLAVLERRDQVWDSARAHDELNWSPFDGMTFNFAVTATYLRGDLAYGQDTVFNTVGSGRFVPRLAVQE